MYSILSDSEKQQGYTVIGLILAIAIIGVISTQFTERLEYDLTTQAETATVNDITQLAQAQINYRWRHSDWATSPSLLFSIFRNVNGVGEPYVFRVTSMPGSALTIETNMRSSGSARRVAQRLGSFADVFPNPDTGEMTIIKAEYAVPLGPLAELNAAYLRRDGSNDMLGDLQFRRDGNAGIVMNENRIEGASRVVARTATNLGLIEADIGAIDTLTVQNFSYSPP